jgi:hypothetical protein
LLALIGVSRRFGPDVSVVAKVLLAGVLAGTASLVPSMPSLIRGLVAFAVYTITIVAVGALPQELRELRPAHWSAPKIRT